jgi:hypothetical protein
MLPQRITHELKKPCVGCLGCQDGRTLVNVHHFRPSTAPRPVRQETARAAAVGGDSSQARATFLRDVGLAITASATSLSSASAAHDAVQFLILIAPFAMLDS